MIKDQAPDTEFAAGDSPLHQAITRFVSEQRLVACLVALFFAFQIYLTFTLNINWDEFFFLAHIYSFQEGRLAVAFQTFHVHLFGWLTYLPLMEADQIVVARLVMVLAGVGTSLCIFRIAESLTSDRHAAFATLAFLVSGYVLGQGASFRADPIATFLMMASLAILFIAPIKWPYAILAAALSGLGLLITIKCAFYLPVYLAALVHRWGKEPHPFKVLAMFAIAGLGVVIVYAAGWMVHGALLSTPGTVSAAPAQATQALNKTVITPALFPQWGYMLIWALFGLVPAILLASALIIGVLQSARRNAALVCLLLAAPVLSLVFYRNAFPYFFPFIMAPAFVAVALVSERLTSNAIRKAIITLMFVGLMSQFSTLVARDQSAQRAVIATVHQIFPEPVPYIDRNSIIPSFPSVGFFMSSWGLESVKTSGRPVLGPVIAGMHPPLLIVNSPAIAKALDPALEYPAPRLLLDDERALRENYIEHWGPIWVAGRALTANGRKVQFKLAIPGRYTIECAGLPVMLDNAALRCGSVVELSASDHELLGADGQNITLRWGSHLHVPRTAPPDKPIYYGF